MNMFSRHNNLGFWNIVNWILSLIARLSETVVKEINEKCKTTWLTSPNSGDIMWIRPNLLNKCKHRGPVYIIHPPPTCRTTPSDYQAVPGKYSGLPCLLVLATA